MSLLQWLGQILACEATPEELDLEVLEDALELLEARAAENLGEYEQAGEVGQQAADRLRQMARILDWLCGDLDAFLDTGDFGRVREAMGKAQCLLDIRDELTQTFCSPQAVLERSLVA